MNNIITDERALEIIRNGKVYIPAKAHYGNRNVTVVCDACKRSNLQACVGHEDVDICLKCVERISQSSTSANPQTGLWGASGGSTPSMDQLTYMIQDSTRMQRPAPVPEPSTPDYRRQADPYGSHGWLRQHGVDVRERIPTGFGLTRMIQDSVRRAPATATMRPVGGVTSGVGSDEYVVTTNMMQDSCRPPFTVSDINNNNIMSNKSKCPDDCLTLMCQDSVTPAKSKFSFEDAYSEK
jgi:hypothetical protein